MAVDSSFLSIINRAFTMLGQTTITSGQLGTPDNRASRLADREFNDHLDALIEDHPWKVHIHRVELDKNATPPEWGWSFAYDFPDGTTPAGYPYCLRVLEINEDVVWGWDHFYGWYLGEPQQNRWKVEERQILSNIDEPLGIRYLGRPANATGMTGQFKELLANYLAVQWCEAIQASDSLSDRLERKLARILQETRSIEGQHGKPDPFRTTSWISQRVT